MKGEYQLVLCTCPDVATAKKLAEQAVKEKLAACVNIFSNVQSIYRWQGAVENTTECLLLIKTSSQHYTTLEKMLQNAHPYETPEIIAMAIERGSANYLAWMAESLR